MGIFDIFKSRERRDREAMMEFMAAVSKPSSKSKIQTAIATISTDKLPDDLNSFCAQAAAELTRHIVTSTGNRIDNNKDYILSGIFNLIFCNHFTYITRTEFELISMVSSIYLFPPNEAADLLGEAIGEYNALTSQNADVIKIIGGACVKWVENPSLEQIVLMSKVYAHCRGDES